MKPGQTLGTIFALAVVCGCYTRSPESTAPTRNTRLVLIQTDPPGMRIFFGLSGTEERAIAQREYVGQSPCALTVRCDKEGRLENTIGGLARPKAILQAEPPHDATNLFAQKQVFAVPSAFVHPPEIPKAVFFDMHKPPSPP